MNQQELADAIGINMQSLSKIERGVNFPTFDTLEKITSVLGVTPNELLCGEWKNTSHMEQEILKFLECEERLNVELAHGQYDNYFDSEEEWKEYELKNLREYIMDYIGSEDRRVSDLYPIKQLIQRYKFQNLLDKYDDLYSLDLFWETIEGHRNINPYEWNPVEGNIILNRHVDEDRECLSSVLTIEGFEDLKGIK
ncbi:helix-turn-helix domain-containing protein [Longibaculum muris]|uniref:helix-turn-helix domain-containing protein n=1 Tax=Longibaculum muris TaxID=1796628 RepID=UPI0012B83E38|nr:helix-turn-helix transcriptional regulator [Longibaculum muris]